MTTGPVPTGSHTSGPLITLRCLFESLPLPADTLRGAYTGRVGNNPVGFSNLLDKVGSRYFSGHIIEVGGWVGRGSSIRAIKVGFGGAGVTSGNLTRNIPAVHAA